MEKIPTAEEFYQHAIYDRSIGDDITDLLNAYAKLHVEAALKTIWDNSKEWDNGFNLTIRVIDNDKESILNAYPLTNIK